MFLILDNFIILFISAIISGFSSISENLILYFLIAIIINCIYIIIENDIFKDIIVLFYLFLSYRNPEFVALSPLLIYNAMKDMRQNKFLIIIFSALIFNPEKNILFLSLFSIYLSIKTMAINDLEFSLYKLRDDMTEENIILKKEKIDMIEDFKKDEKLALLEERNRISRRLHDSIGHTISGTILQAEALKTMIADENIRKNIESIQENLKKGMHEIRSTLHELKTDSISLESSLREIAENCNLNIDLLVKGCDKIDFNFKLDLISLVKECITNTIRHSDSDEMTIKIIEQRNFVSVLIRDNGSKFIDIDGLQKGIGLNGIREIEEKYSGNSDISYKDGFRIYLILRKDRNENTDNRR
ncbi:MAG: histidine kinase [Tissierellia bacterium]|nr:histidine kinase [Tissierellia bacterium]